jgi:hypothetical protein
MAAARDAAGVSRLAPIKQLLLSIISRRSSGRSDHIRRSTLTVRPQNIRSGRALERTHNSRRHQAESRSDEVRVSTRSYRGSHRAEHPHRAGNGRSAAQDRNSRVGGHHADPQPDRSRR